MLDTLPPIPDAGYPDSYPIGIKPSCVKSTSCSLSRKPVSFSVVEIDLIFCVELTLMLSKTCSLESQDAVLPHATRPGCLDWFTLHLESKVQTVSSVGADFVRTRRGARVRGANRVRYEQVYKQARHGSMVKSCAAKGLVHPPKV
jgi:hypothetical protein